MSTNPLYIRVEHILCNLCGAEKHLELFRKRGWRIVRCLNCGLVFVNPRPISEDLRGIYNPQKQDKLVPDQDAYLRKHVERPKRYLEIVLRYKSCGRILDVGCNVGSFLKAAKERGFQVVGVEISQQAVQVAVQTFGIREEEIVCASFEEVPLDPEQFDVITFWDTLEHLSDPSSALAKAWNLLKYDGIVVIRCPNIDGFLPKMTYYTLAKVLKKWPHPAPPKHLYEFSDKTLSALLRKNGFVVLDILPSEIPLSCLIGNLGFFGRTLQPLYKLANRIGKPNAMILVARKAG